MRASSALEQHLLHNLRGPQEQQPFLQPRLWAIRPPVSNITWSIPATPLSACMSYLVYLLISCFHCKQNFKLVLLFFKFENWAHPKYNIYVSQNIVNRKEGWRMVILTIFLIYRYLSWRSWGGEKNSCQQKTEEKKRLGIHFQSSEDFEKRWDGITSVDYSKQYL